MYFPSQHQQQKEDKQMRYMKMKFKICMKNQKSLKKIQQDQQITRIQRNQVKYLISQNLFNKIRIIFIKIKQESSINLKNKYSLGPNPKEILKYFDYYDEEDDYQSSEQDYSNQAILSPEQYAKLENQLMEECQTSQDDGFLIELEYIFNKVLFDVLNETLDYYRSFIYGKLQNYFEMFFELIEIIQI
ncbi:unnamed protein product [Paramecium sonneborni]|uniref:Uncharacterized protein n=1 Tax=Paramecium sonneborni TaxID=65129 RepID=A0A8S1RQG2_9CILI|nr:unnamed protein product [Paramecium sonneborni]